MVYNKVIKQTKYSPNIQCECLSVLYKFTTQLSINKNISNFKRNPRETPAYKDLEKPLLTKT